MFSRTLPFAVACLSLVGLLAQAPAAAAQAPGWPTILEGSEWEGSETLPGYDRLVFSFHRNGQATMIDADGVRKGTWHQAGSRVTLAFSSGRVLYVGIIQGDSLVGVAGNGARRWAWSVQRQ